MSNVRRPVSKALLMSIVARCVLCATLGIFRPSCMYCFSVVRSVVVECRALKPCLVVGDRRMCWVIMLIRRLSRILMGLHNKVIGLEDKGSVNIFLGLSIGMILSFFQMYGMLLWSIVWLKMSVKAPMASGPRCFMCR